VKFLVDNQLPRALVPVLTQAGHEAAHVLDIELAQSNDHAIWKYAAEHGYVLISKDADFADLAVIGPYRVRLIWVRIGNCRKTVLLESFKNSLSTIEQELNTGEHLIELY
jgi:predicted nuclease of predicted toxin-antitoxin system